MRGLVLKSAALLFLATIFNACEEEEAQVNVTGVTVTNGEVSTAVGEEVQLTATIEPEGATNSSVTWATSDESVAIVSEEGVLVAVGPGEVEIVASTVDGEFTSSVNISVNASLLGTLWTQTSMIRSGCSNAEENGTESCEVECTVLEFEEDGTITFTGDNGPEGVVNYTSTETELTVSYEDNGEQVSEKIPYTIVLDKMELTFGADDGGCSKVEVYTAN